MNLVQGTPQRRFSLPSAGWVIENIISLAGALIIGWLLVKFLFHTNPNFWPLLLGAVLGRLLVLAGERFSRRNRLAAEGAEKTQMLRMRRRRHPGYIEVPKVTLSVDDFPPPKF
jgi:uncharacterized membrane protein YeaQ/YmgE (transglycosylase-associated protein family)